FPTRPALGVSVQPVSRPAMRTRSRVRSDLTTRIITPFSMESRVTQVTVQVIIPARNEEDCLGRCLASLVSQEGIDFSITVVDDGSTDRTRAIAQSFPGVRVLSATEPFPGVSGKCNALVAGVQGATAPWLLFTDADTFHYPGSLAAAVAEA